MPGAQNAHMAMQKFDLACTLFHQASTLSDLGVQDGDTIHYGEYLS